MNITTQLAALLVKLDELLLLEMAEDSRMSMELIRLSLIEIGKVAESRQLTAREFLLYHDSVQTCNLAIQECQSSYGHQAA